MKKSKRKIILAIILILLVLINIAMIINIHKKESSFKIIKWKTYVSTVDMPEANIRVGDIVIVEDIKSEEIESEEFIVKTVDSQNKKDIMITKSPGIKDSDIEGKIIYKIGWIGYIIMFIQTLTGTILYTLFFICILVIIKIAHTPEKNKSKS